MTYRGRFWWYALWLAAAVLGGQAWQIQTFSLLPWPIFLSGLLAYLPVRSWRMVLAASVIAETLSGLPPGMMTVVVWLPWVLSWWPRKPAPAFSLGFLAWIMVVGAAQYAMLAGWAWVWQGYDVPAVVPVMWAATSVAVFLATVAWYEQIEPYRRPRTQPRFKHL